jgi:hypothetical protein
VGRDYFPVVKRRKYVMNRLRMSGAIPQSTIYIYMAWTGKEGDGGSPGEIQSRLISLLSHWTNIEAIRLTTWKYCGST